MGITGTDFQQPTRMTVSASVAEHDTTATTDRTKNAPQPGDATLQRTGNRGKNLPQIRAKGNAASAAARAAKAAIRNADVLPVILECKARGLSLRAIAGELMQRGIPTARGKLVWSAMQVQRVLLASHGQVGHS